MSQLTVSPVVQSLTVSESVQSLTIAAPTSSPAGAAGGDLQGTYPNPTVHRIHGVNMQSGTPTDGDLWQYQASNTRWRHRTFVNLLGDNGIGWDGTTLTIGALVLGNGEFLSNGTNGTLKLGVNGTNALDYSMLVDGTSWGYGVKLSTSQNSNPSNTSAGFWFVSPLQISTGVPLSFDAAQTSVVQHVGAFTGTRLATHLSVSLGTLVQYGQDSSGAICIVDHAALGAANRRPSVTHTDPTLYVYARGSADANDFARMSHDTTDALLEAGSGKLRLKGASAVRIEGPSGGFDLPATAGSNGQVLTTDGTNASWQTPTGGGVAFDEVRRIAFIGI